MAHFKTGQEHYLRQEYKQATEQFILGAVQEHDSYCMMWLGQCYECGLGVEKDLVEAKDLYTVASTWLTHNDTKGKVWLQERLKCLKDIPDTKSRTRFYYEIGNVKIVKSTYINEPTVRFNLDETVITINHRDVYQSGYHFAQENLRKLAQKWTCDSSGRRFYDGYTLETDHFTLHIKRGDTDKHIKAIDGNKLTLSFPISANLDYIYVQESILKKVKELLFSLAQDTLPQVLAEISKRINVPYCSCRVVSNSQSYVACNYGNGNNITFTAQCIQLPKKSLEALCIHELTHNFVNDHSQIFYEKMKELGGLKIVDIDKNLWKENRWPYLKF